SALKRDKWVIPVLVNNARIPRKDALPTDIAPLTRKNAVRLTHERFAADCEGLVKELKDALRAISAKSGQAEPIDPGIEVDDRASTVALLQEAEQQHSAAAAVSPEASTDVEELANWDAIKGGKSPGKLRDHLARFPNGSTEPLARAQLEALIWSDRETR